MVKKMQKSAATGAVGHRQGLGPADLAGRPGRLCQGPGRRHQGLRGIGQGRHHPAAQDPGRRRRENHRGHQPHGQHGHRHLVQGFRPLGQAREHLRRACCQGTEQAGRALGQGHQRADRPHRRTQPAAWQKLSGGAPPRRKRPRASRRQAGAKPAATPPATAAASGGQTCGCFTQGRFGALFCDARTQDLLQRNIPDPAPFYTEPMNREKGRVPPHRAGPGRWRATGRHLRDRRAVRPGRIAGRPGPQPAGPLCGRVGRRLHCSGAGQWHDAARPVGLLHRKRRQRRRDLRPFLADGAGL
jgi:hypothetical protein